MNGRIWKKSSWVFWPYDIFYSWCNMFHSSAWDSLELHTTSDCDNWHVLSKKLLLPGIKTTNFSMIQPFVYPEASAVVEPVQRIFLCTAFLVTEISLCICHPIVKPSVGSEGGRLTMSYHFSKCGVPMQLSSAFCSVGYSGKTLGGSVSPSTGKN